MEYLPRGRLTIGEYPIKSKLRLVAYLGKASHALWRCPPFDQLRKEREQVKPFLLGQYETSPQKLG